MKSNLTQEISQKDSRVRNQAETKTSYRSLTAGPEFIKDDLQTTLYNPTRAEVVKYAENKLFLLSIGGENYDVKVRVGCTKIQLEQIGEVIKEALTWADIPHNTEVV